MINANEFRLGNYVEYDQVPSKIETLNIENEFGLYVFPPFLGLPNNRVFLRTSPDPIPLTEEWLLKLGFKLEKVRDEMVYCSPWFYDAKQIIITKEFDINLFNNRQDSFFVIDKEIKYVHRLQNLYFALTGKELTIKE